ncbi:hypothetical protein [Microbacterium sp. GbtcB4]|uniref:hypothetical protein n=1 Tax=Microbacterium sp. GbtcB4 TaxID=2824749 RepID=UPI001C2F555E
MGQCNIYIATARDQELKDLISLYLKDVCDPNVAEMQALLESSGYTVPLPLDAAPTNTDPVESEAINDTTIALGQWFATPGVVRNEEGFPAGLTKLDAVEPRLPNVAVHPAVAGFDDLAHALDLKGSLIATANSNGERVSGGSQQCLHLAELAGNLVKSAVVVYPVW